MSHKKFKREEVLALNLMGQNFPYGDKTKLKGKTFSKFRLKGMIITVNDDEQFKQDFLDGNIHSITIDESQIDDEEGGKRVVWSFVEYTTNSAEVKMADVVRSMEHASNVVDFSVITDADLAILKEKLS